MVEEKNKLAEKVGKRESAMQEKQKTSKQASKPSVQSATVKTDKKAVAQKENKKPKETKKTEGTKKAKSDDSTPTTVIKNPLSTEKAIRLMESENKLLFVIDMKSTKQQVKKAIEQLFNVKVDKVNTFVTPKGQKRAYVKFATANPAIDVATTLGLV